MRTNALLVVLGQVALVLAGCGQPQRQRPLRFGDLEVQWRTLKFEHDIQVFEAANGLRVALLPDPRTNLVTVDVRFEVGAAEDPDGRTGMAHLVEHLMFQLGGSSHAATIGDELGAVTLEHNAWTTWDETHFTAIAMAGRLDEVLALEARRLSASCDQLDPALFIRERDVVLQEDAQRHDHHASLRESLAVAIWGTGHPYTRPVGSRQIADVGQDEVCAFVAAHYAPDRAILVVTGNFDLDHVTRTITTTFGELTRPATAARVELASPKLDGLRTEHVADVDQATAVVFFEAPPWGDQDAPRGHAIAAYLATFLEDAGEERDWVTQTSVSAFGGSRAPVLAATVAVDDVARLDEAVELIYDSAGKLTDQSALDASLPAVRGSLRARYARGYDQFLGRGPLIADYLQYTTHKLFFVSDLVELDTLSAAEIGPYARDHFNRERSEVALIRPSGAPARRTRARVAASDREHDLQPWRMPIDAAEATRPLTTMTSRITADVRELELGNGLRVLLAPSPHALLVDARLVFPAGTSADPADRPGLATAAAALLGPDFERRYRRGDVSMLEFAFDLGTHLETNVDEQTTTFSASGLAVYADWHLWRLFWLLDAGVYAADAIEAMQRRARRATTAGEPEVDSATAKLRESLFGADHPYAVLHDRIADRAQIIRGDLERFRDRHYRAGGATLIVSGRFDADVMQAEIEALFGTWPNASATAVTTVPTFEPVRGPTWITAHDDSRIQASATIAFAAASDRGADRAARLVLAAMLEDRVRVVRDGQGASYGITVGYGNGLGGAVLAIQGELDPDRAGKALVALLAETARVRDKPEDVVEDFVRARRRALALVLANAGGAADLADELHRSVRDGLPIDYLATLAAAVGAITPDDVTDLARRDLDPARMVVLLRGPASVIDAAISAAGGTPAHVFEE